MITFTDPLTLVTGKQGAGKTLLAIAAADGMKQADPTVTVWQLNIRNADPRYLAPLPFDPSEMVEGEGGVMVPRWTTLPPKSVILVDEAHRVFPQRGPGRPPLWIEAMSETRYQGVRWVLITQAPASVDAFLRDRTNRHLHVERKGGLGGAAVYEFDRCVDADRDYRARKDATLIPFKYPKQFFSRYDSAKDHHFRIRIPWKLWLVFPFLALAGYVAWNVVAKVGDVMNGVTEKIVGQAGPASDEKPRPVKPSESSDSQPIVRDPVAWAEQFRPLLPAQPWSAPAYQGRKVAAQPEVYCISKGINGREGCNCYTEQATRYQLDSATCLDIARWGNYNPFRDPIGRVGEASREPEKPRAAASGEAMPSADPAGVWTQPGEVGSLSMGEVWGRVPEVLRAQE